MDSLGGKIRNFRNEKGLTQVEFANRLDISPITIIRYEKGDRQPKSDFFDKISQIFPGTDLSVFFSEKSEKEVTSTSDIQKERNNSDEIKIISGEEIDLKAMWRVLWQKKMSVIKTIWIFSILGILYAFIATPLFLSNISIVPASEETGMDLGAMTSMAASFGVSIGGESQNLNIVDIVESRRMKEMILNKKWVTRKYPIGIDLITFWEINDTTKILYRSIQALKSVLSLIIQFDYQDPMLNWTEKAISELDDRILVTQGESGLITVEVWMEEQQLVSDITKFIGEAVIDFNNEISSDYWRHNREFIQQRMEDVREGMDKAETALTNFQMENRRIIDSPELQMILARLMREVEIQTQLYITLQQEYELARIEEVKDTPSIVILDEANYPAEKDKPKRIMLILLSTVVGIILSPPIVLMKRAINYNKKTQIKKRKWGIITFHRKKVSVDSP